MRFLIESNNIEYDNLGNPVPYEISNLLKRSKIRDRHKNLLVCYHGTNADFKDFKSEFISQASGNIGWFGKGFYFTTDKSLAREYGSNIKHCYLNVTNPFIYSDPQMVYALYDWTNSFPKTISFNDETTIAPMAYTSDEERDSFTNLLKSKGYDGVIYSYRQSGYRPNSSSNKTYGNAKEIVVFDEEQIITL